MGSVRKQAVPRRRSPSAESALLVTSIPPSPLQIRSRVFQHPTTGVPDFQRTAFAPAGAIASEIVINEMESPQKTSAGSGEKPSRTSPYPLRQNHASRYRERKQFLGVSRDGLFALDGNAGNTATSIACGILDFLILDFDLRAPESRRGMSVESKIGNPKSKMARGRNMGMVQSNAGQQGCTPPEREG
jgi:hypothetical protein